MWENIWCFMKTNLWALITSIISVIGAIAVYIYRLIMKTKSKEVSERFLAWMITKCENRTLGLRISPVDINNVYPKTRTEKIIDRLSVTSDSFKDRVLRNLVKNKQLVKTGEDEYMFYIHGIKLPNQNGKK